MHLSLIHFLWNNDSANEESERDRWSESEKKKNSEMNPKVAVTQ